MSSNKTCLIFGGNGFIGAEIVKSLLGSEKANFDIAIANRGKSWDWDRRETVKPFVKCFKCNRKKPMSRYQELVSYVNSVGTLDIVVDLSAYSLFAVEEVVGLLSREAVKVGLYVFISSDSVYEVCVRKPHSGPTREADAVRPSDKRQRSQLKHHDSYGHKKLQCEEFLQDLKKFPSVTLRLADVIGQQDSTERWWQYQLWVKIASACKLPIVVAEHLKGQQMSFVYASDIAERIRFLAEAKTNTLEHLHREAFNLAFNVTVTTEELVGDICEALKLPACRIDYRSGEAGAPQIFPSVDNGAIDISKASSLLPWQPTPWKEAVRTTVRFYEEAAKSEVYKHKLKDCLRSLFEDLQGVTDVELMQCQTESMFNIRL